MNTNDSRESAAIYVTAALLEKGIIVQGLTLWLQHAYENGFGTAFEAQKQKIK